MRESLPLRSQVLDMAEATGVWNKKKEKEYEKIVEDILSREKIINTGGIDVQKARDIAIELKNLRSRIIELRAGINALDACTAEGVAETLRMEYLISECTVVKKGGKRYFKDLNDFYDKQEEDVAIAAQIIFTQMMYYIDDNLLDSLPEFKFLKDYKFMNDDFELIDGEGNVIDDEGNAIESQAEALEFKPFLSGGKPIEVKEEEEEEEKEEEVVNTE